MDIVDPLYGRMRFRGLLADLLLTPEVQRLREVRLANIDLVQFPGFAEISRFQHSAGVAYLAGEAARAIGLPHADGLNLQAAALYHDAASPPFGHAMEAVLREHFGYDHELETVKLIKGSAEEGPNGRTVFVDQPAAIGRVCRRRVYARQGADCDLIAQLVAGQGPLGPLIKGTMDLDNIDNVYRAAMAMGITRELDVPLNLARSFRFVGGRVGLSETATKLVRHWQRTRQAVYGALLADAFDFSLQGMLKHALELAVAGERAGGSGFGIREEGSGVRGQGSEREEEQTGKSTDCGRWEQRPSDRSDPSDVDRHSALRTPHSALHEPLIDRWHWRLTDGELRALLRQRAATRAIVDRMRLGRVYPIVGFYRVDEPETLGEEVHVLAGIAERAVAEALHLEAYTHLWYDRRFRRIDLPVVREFPIDLVHATPGTRPMSTAVVLGVLAANRQAVTPAERRRVHRLYNAAFGRDLPEQALPIETPAPDEQQLQLRFFAEDA